MNDGRRARQRSQAASATAPSARKLHPQRLPSHSLAFGSISQGSSLGRIVRGASAFRAASGDVKGDGAPQAWLVLAVVMTLAALAFPAAAMAAATLTVDPVTTHGITAAHVEGEVSVPADDGETYWGFQYSTDGVVWNGSPFDGGSLQPGESAPVAQDLSGLGAETSYQVRLAAFNTAVGAEEFSSPVSFETDPAPIEPTATVDPAGSVAYTTAQIQGAVDPEGGNEESGGAYVPIHWVLQFSPSADPGTFSDAASGDLTGAEAESEDPIDVPASPAQLSGLIPGHTYTYRLLVTYAGKTAEPVPSGEFTTLAVTKPGVENLEVTNVTAISAHFEADLKTNAPGGPLDSAAEEAYAAHWSFSPGGSSGTTPAVEAEETVSGDATGLEPHREYTATFTASNAGGSEEISVPFETEAIGPDVSPATLWNLTPTSIQLNANVNAHNSVLTDCHFEYGAGGSLNQTAPCDAPFVGGTYSAPAGEGDAMVSARISGLAPGTDYDFRLIATNGAGNAEGAAQTFHTPGGPVAETCPNQPRRVEQHATDLPGCRAFEMVSPLDKNGGDVVADEGFVTIAAGDGNGLAFSSKSAFGDNVGAGVAGESQYIARRASNGWTTHSILPTPNPQTHQTISALSNKIPLFSEDLSTGLLWAYDLPGTLDDTPNRKGIYIENTATRAVTPITRSFFDPIPPLAFADEFSPNATSFYSGLSADAQHVLLSVAPRLLEKTPTGENVPTNSVYEWSDGALHVVSILPDGTVAPSATVKPASYRGALSRDGSRAIFLSPREGNRQLYLRIDGSRTAWVSEPERPGAPEPEGVSFQSMTPDGKHVFFVSSTQLVEEDHNSGPDLYRYTDGEDPEDETDNLTMITHTGAVEPEFLSSGIGSGDATAVIGTSDDGNRVYYLETEKLFFWEEGETRVVSSRIERNPGVSRHMNATAYGPGSARVSPDGMWLSFLTNRSFASGLDTAGPSLTGQPVEPVVQTGHETGDQPHYNSIQAYLYGAENNTLNCVSCVPDGVSRYGATVRTKVTNGLPIGMLLGNRPRYLADDGTMFFSSNRDSLVASDTNGVADTYEFDPAVGVPRLLSTGTASQPAMFADASAGGDDVFIATRAPLVRRDTDDLVDFYDVRVGGGFFEPGMNQPADCVGEGCRGGNPAPAPAAPAISSQAPSKGNSAGRPSIKKCSKQRKKQSKHCKKRNKHKKHHRHSANKGRNSK
ncbi:MAG TPA: hypothetical protein VF125_06270 [Solirubrobacterales bacterium]